MSYPPFSLEAAFKQDIEKITETDDLEFMKKHFLFVNAYRCKTEEKPQQCIEDGRELFGKFAHGAKLAKQRAFYCFNKCKEGRCYDECKNELRGSLNEFTAKMDPVMNDYLLQFVPKHLG